MRIPQFRHGLAACREIAGKRRVRGKSAIRPGALRVFDDHFSRDPGRLGKVAAQRSSTCDSHLEVEFERVEWAELQRAFESLFCDVRVRPVEGNPAVARPRPGVVGIESQSAPDESLGALLIRNALA